MTFRFSIGSSGARLLLVAGMTAAALSLVACSSKIPGAATSRPVCTRAQCPWLNSHLPIARRVALILRRMTLADKIKLAGVHHFEQGAGSLILCFEKMRRSDPTCLPPVGLRDGPNGVGDGATGVTQLPAGAALAASFSRRLAYEYGQVIGAEQRSKGMSVDFGPTVNIDRDPRWGREFESLAEDPHLAGRIAAAEIRGIQSEGVIAQVKHFDAYNQETYRNTPLDDVTVSRRTLHEIYMPAFRYAIRHGKVGSIMCSYATVNGRYSCENHYLLSDVLRRQWGFNGFVTTDYTALHSLAGVKAGADLELPAHWYGRPLLAAVRAGQLRRAYVNSMVAPILRQLFRFNLIDHPRPATMNTVATTAAHRSISTRVAEAGTVLLKNVHHLLPLETREKIVVIGPAASAQVTSGGGGSASVIPSKVISPLAGIEARAGSAQVRYVQGLPTNAELTPIPATDLSVPFEGESHAGPYSAMLRVPQTGTYVIGLSNNCHCYSIASLAIDGRTLVNNPGTPPNPTYTAAIHLRKGRRYRLTVTGPVMMPIAKKRERKFTKPLQEMQQKKLGADPRDQLLWAPPSVVHADIDEAVRAARSAQVAVVVVADDTESEGADRPDLRLPSAQNALVSAVAKVNPRTVVVIQAGAPIVMPWIARVPAILDTWYPGQTDGRALANVLYGKVDPSGHLPVTFPARLADVPAASPARFPGVNGKVRYSPGGLLIGYRWYESRHIRPLFPFGFGLSYTRFHFSDLRLSRRRVGGVTAIRVSARVSNVGPVAGADVAQLYLGMPASSGQPPRVLVGFRRVMLASRASKVVHFTITPRQEWWWGHGGWTESAGTYRVYMGDSSALANLPLRGSYRMRRSIGSRAVTVSAPKIFKPGARAEVSVTLSAGGTETLGEVNLGLKAPGRWRVTPFSAVAQSKVAADKAVTAKFAVTPPSWAVARFVTLRGTADLSAAGCASANTQCMARRDGGETVRVSP